MITYEPNVLGLKGPRRIGVVVPGMTSDGNRVTLKSKDHDSDSIVARMKYNGKAKWTYFQFYFSDQSNVYQ